MEPLPSQMSELQQQWMPQCGAIIQSGRLPGNTTAWLLGENTALRLARGQWNQGLTWMDG